MATDRDSGKLVVVLALPTVPGREQPTGNVVVNDDEVGRAVRAARVPGPKPRGQSRLPTGVVTKAVEVVAHQYQEEGDAEALKEAEENKVVLPGGTPLLSVAGEEVPKAAVGPALEFIEFCAAFYEPMNMKETEGPMTLREIVHGCKLKKRWGSLVVRVHVRLLSVILSDESVSPGLENESSWLKFLKSHLDKKTLPLSMHKYATALAGGADGYLSLSIEEKLQLLNMLCNDALSTGVLRGHIEKVKVEYDEKKEDDKKKEIKAGKSITLTSEPSTEDKRITSVRTRGALKREPDNLPEASISGRLGSIGSETFRRDAVKTEAIAWDCGSRALWKLKGGEDRSSVISQVIYDIGATPNEEWTVYSEKDEEVLAVYLDQKKNG
ncbi:hypothetical protein KC19_4G029400 [Ceratodon purpureus]|uniref:WHIM1 domain-containing protein n=1 Tax=Ceratodon purpureus TaxID=3225 RepID=A0A8T0I604_CERPU|nr:hypothetical protein KC19_4G029000 [Ceratodon purpureus]KAG0578520.1 hypothetical protein KC19_4G029400 [Ceratodon purpureus]